MDNLIGVEAVSFVKQSDPDGDLVFNTLSYLMFLKRKPMGKNNQVHQLY